MKRISVLKMVFHAILIASYFPVDAAADDKTCVLKAGSDKVHVLVWDEDSDGDRQDKIYEGWLESGQRQTIKSATGYINYSYQQADADRSYGENSTCKGGNTIQVP